MTDALASCPFCGGDSLVDHGGEWDDLECAKCGTSAPRNVWRTRADEIERLRAENERLRGALTDALDALTQDEITFKADHWALTKRIAALIAKPALSTGDTAPAALSPATGEG